MVKLILFRIWFTDTDLYLLNIFIYGEIILEVDVSQSNGQFWGSSTLPGYQHAKSSMVENISRIQTARRSRRSSACLWITVMSRQSAIAVVLSLLPAVVATFASSLRRSEALIALALLSLGLWGAFCWMASWIAAGSLSW